MKLTAQNSALYEGVGAKIERLKQCGFDNRLTRGGCLYCGRYHRGAATNANSTQQ